MAKNLKRVRRAAGRADAGRGPGGEAEAAALASAPASGPETPLAGSEDEGDAASSRSVPSGRRTAAAAAADRDDERSRWSFFPQTYTLPIDWGLFAEDFRRRGGVWIAKPVGRAQGKGIFLVNRLAQLSAWRKGGAGAAAGGDADGSDTVSLRPHGGYARPGSDAQRENDEHGDVEVYVVQRYLERPLVVGGRK